MLACTGSVTYEEYYKCMATYHHLSLSQFISAEPATAHLGINLTKDLKVNTLPAFISTKINDIYNVDSIPEYQTSK